MSKITVENDNNSLISLTLERQCIAGLIKFPDSLFDYDVFVSSNTFTHPIHKNLYILIKQNLEEHKNVSDIILAQQLKNLGISEYEGVNVLDYIESLNVITISKEVLKDVFKELFKLCILRERIEDLRQAAKVIREHKNKSLQNIIAEVDAINNKISNIFTAENNEPSDLFADLKETVELLGNSPRVLGVENPYPISRDLYGDFDNKSLNFFIARAKSGKSSLLMNIAFLATSNTKEKVKALVIDTELDKKLVQRRLLSSLTDVNEYYIKTGLWRQNPDMTLKIRGAWEHIKEYENKIDHLYVGSADIDECVSIIRRWHRKNIPRDGSIKALIIFDYVKLTAEMSDQKYKNFKDYQIVANKVDKLKRLAAELDCPILTAGQSNRTNEERTNASKRDDTGRAVGLSDQINALSDRIFLFNRCALDEIAEAKTEYGLEPTHKLVPLYLRVMGPHGSTRERVKFAIKDKAEYWRDNFIYFRMDKFRYIELTDLYNAEQKKKEQIDLQDGELVHDDSTF